MRHKSWAKKVEKVHVLDWIQGGSSAVQTAPSLHLGRPDLPDRSIWGVRVRGLDCLWSDRPVENTSSLLGHDATIQLEQSPVRQKRWVLLSGLSAEVVRLTMSHLRK